MRRRRGSLAPVQGGGAVRLLGAGEGQGDADPDLPKEANTLKEKGERALDLCCPKKHALKPHERGTDAPYYSCDVCARVFECAGLPMWECRICDYDVCRMCHSYLLRQLRQQCGQAAKQVADPREGPQLGRCDRRKLLALAAKLLFALPSVFVVLAGLVAAIATHVALSETAATLVGIVRERTELNLAAEFSGALSGPLFANEISRRRHLRGELPFPSNHSDAEALLRYLRRQTWALERSGVTTVALASTADGHLLGWHRDPGGAESSLEFVLDSGELLVVGRDPRDGSRGPVLRTFRNLNLTAAPWVAAARTGQQNWTSAVSTWGGFQAASAVLRVDRGPGGVPGVFTAHLGTEVFSDMLAQNLLGSNRSVLFVLEGGALLTSEEQGELDKACSAGAVGQRCSALDDACQPAPAGGCTWDSSGLVVATSLPGGGGIYASDPLTGAELAPRQRARAHSSGDARIRLAAAHIIAAFGDYATFAAEAENEYHRIPGNVSKGNHLHASLSGDGRYMFDAFLFTDGYGLRWVCVLLLAEEEMYYGTHKLQQETAVTISVMLVLVFSVSVVVTQGVARPMKSLKRKLDRRARINEIEYTRLNRALSLSPDSGTVVQ